MAASSKGIRAGRAFVELFADDSKLVRGLRRAEARLKAFGQSVTALGKRMFAIGSVGVGALATAAGIFAAAGDKLAKASGRTGVAVADLATLGFAAEQSGSDFETFEKSLQKMQRAIVEARDGTETYRDALAALGLTWEDLIGMSPDEQFRTIADAMSRIKSPALRTATAMEIFGRSGTQLQPLMAEGRKGIETLEEQARSLGLVMSGEDAKAAEVLGDTVHILWLQLKRVAQVIGAAVAGAFQRLIEASQPLLKSIINWIDQNRDLANTILWVSAAVATAGATLITLGVSIKIVGAALGGLASIGVLVGKLLGGMLSLLSLIATPAGMVAAAVLGIGAAFMWATGAFGDFARFASQAWAGFLSDAQTAWGGVVAALQGGDLQAAVTIAVTFLKLQWQKGISFLRETWVNFKAFWIETWINATSSLSAVIIRGWAKVREVWAETVAGIQVLWQEATTGIANTWGDMITWAAQKMVGLFTDSEEQAAQARQFLEEDNNRDRRRREREKDKNIADIGAERSARLTEIEQTKEGSLAANEEARRQKLKALDKQSGQEITALEAELAAARKEFDDAVAAGHAAGDRARERIGRKGGGANDLELGLQAARDRVDVKGTFSAAAVRGLGPDSLSERTARAAEGINQKMGNLLAEFRNGFGLPVT